MTWLDLSVPLGLGVVSSLHCAQMCGPIVLAYSLGGRSSPLQHVCYNGGRIATYAFIGALAGAAGEALGLLGIQQMASIVSGALMVLAGALMSAPRAGLVKLDRLGLSSLYSRTLGRLLLVPGAAGKLALGLAMGFLPCGLLYAALLKAASTGSAAAGAASMAAFGAGTAGMLLAIGLFSSAVGLRLGRWSHAMAAASVMAIGAMLLWRGLATYAPGMSCHAGM